MQLTSWKSKTGIYILLPTYELLIRDGQLALNASLSKKHDVFSFRNSMVFFTINHFHFLIIWKTSLICIESDCRTVWCPVCTRNFPVVWCGRGLGIGLDSSSSIAGYRLCNYDCQVIKGYINHKPWDHFMCIIWYDPIQYTIPMHIGTPFITMIIVIWQWDMTQSNPQFQYMSTPPLWSFRQCTVRYDPI